MNRPKENGTIYSRIVWSQSRGRVLSSHDKDYSPDQVRAMVEKFGAPGEYEV